MVKPIRLEDGTSVVDDGGDDRTGVSASSTTKLETLLSGMPTLDEILSRKEGEDGGDAGGDKEILFDSKEADYIFNPNIFYRLDEDRLIMFAQGWKNFRFIRVNMN